MIRSKMQLGDPSSSLWRLRSTASRSDFGLGLRAGAPSSRTMIGISPRHLATPSRMSSVSPKAISIVRNHGIGSGSGSSSSRSRPHLPAFAGARPQLMSPNMRYPGTPRHLSTTPTPLSPVGTSSSSSLLTPATSANDLAAATATATATASTTDDALTPVSTIFDPIIDPLASFLLSLPHPFGYGATIIILTLLVRTVFTLPISLWQRKRALKARRLVDPKMKIINEQLAKSLVAESRKKGLTYDQYILELRRQLAKAQSTLHRLHGTNPTITTWSPLLVHIPIFVTLSLTIRKTLEIPSSPVFSESFFWIEKLGEVDPYGILPLLGMSMAFGNAELVGRRNQAAADSAAEAVRIKNEAKDTFDTSASASAESEQSPPTSPGTSSPQREASGLFAPRSSNVSRPAKSGSSLPSASTSTTPASPPRARRLSTSASTHVNPSFYPSASAQTSSSSVSSPRPRSSKQVVATSRSQQENPSPSHKQLVDADAPGRSRSTFTPARQQEIRRNFMAGVLRFSALGFGMIASQMPAGVVLYWVTSIGFSLVQNVLLSWLPQRRQASAATKAALATSQATTEPGVASIRQ
ncbi:hypothetical protein IAU59_004288 [Kwoniella sp. CBS 9459]